MSTPTLGIVTGAVLGLLDGLSAWCHAEARTMMVWPVNGSSKSGIAASIRRKPRIPRAIVSEAIENIPPGYRARDPYTFSGADEFEEVFEIAEVCARRQRSYSAHVSKLLVKPFGYG